MRFSLLAAIAGVALLAAPAAWNSPRSPKDVLSPADYRATAPGRGVPLPRPLPVPAVPAVNPFSPAKAELGRLLFYDSRLSGNGTFSCASCHRQALAFTDGRRRAVGATGEEHRRNAMSLANVAYNRSFNWADARTGSLEEQMLVPMFGEHPVELGLTGAEEKVLARLAGDDDYGRRFAEVFPEDPRPVRFENVVRAIATFERTLVSASSAYDRWAFDGEEGALSASARRGLDLFFSPRLSCSECHGGFNFAGNTHWYGVEERLPVFHNNGLYRLARSRYPAIDTGRHEVTGRRRDMGAFRAPTLRNVELTAPYMHDGSVATLEEVVAHYSAGGRTLTGGPYRGVGRRNRYKSKLVRPLRLTPAEASDLVAFLRSLTDHEFVTDPRFGDPRASSPASAEP